MKRNILLLTTMTVLLGSAMTSCVEDTDTTVELSKTCYISSFSLGNVRRTMHALDQDGNDSTYVNVYTASAYAFSIDQLNGTITNPEPLLYNSHLDAVLCNITSSSGLVRYHVLSDDPNDNLNSDDWTYYSSSDSINLTRPLLLQVVSTDGTHTRDYTLTVNVYQTSPDSLAWTQVADCEALSSLTVMRAKFEDGELCVTGNDANGSTYTIKPLAEDAQLQPSGALDLQHTGIADVDYMLDNLLIDDDAEWLPTESVSGAALTSSFGTVRYIAAGLRAETYKDTYAVVWGGRKGASCLMHFPWNTTYNLLPALNDLQVVTYNGCFVAAGLKSVNDSSYDALDHLFVSKDYGTTWNSNTTWQTPSALHSRCKPMALAASEEALYIVSGTQIWEARLGGSEK